MTYRELWLRLARISGMHRSRLLQLADQIVVGSVTVEHLHTLGCTESQCRQFFSLSPAELAAINLWLESPLHHLINVQDPLYPPLLRTIASFPLILFVAGDPLLLSSPQLAIVGSRNCSAYGRQWGHYFAQQLAAGGLTITSGLALGIDGIAHRGALSVEGKTVAVLGSGLNRIYPDRHQSLAAEIQASGGALISEFPLCAPPLPAHFPRRNRIISGLSRGTLVVEATQKSGSLVTARYALEQNRDIYALPGALGNPCSEGTHWLIQEGALLVTHPDNILEQVKSGINWLTNIPVNENICASGEDVPLPFADVLDNVGDEVTPVDVVAERAGQPVPAVVAKLLELELAGWIAAVPGGYVRLRRACHVRRTNVFV
ncbi:DNA-protecting protein DprA [Enterobacteriaceae bacterium LUAb1]